MDCVPAIKYIPGSCVNYHFKYPNKPLKDTCHSRCTLCSNPYPWVVYCVILLFQILNHFFCPFPHQETVSFSHQTSHLLHQYKRTKTKQFTFAINSKGWKNAGPNLRVTLFHKGSSQTIKPIFNRNNSKIHDNNFTVIFSECKCTSKFKEINTNISK